MPRERWLDGDFACRARHAQPTMRDRRRSEHRSLAAVTSRGKPGGATRRAVAKVGSDSSFSAIWTLAIRAQKVVS